MNVAYDKWIRVFERDLGYCQYCEMDLLGSFSLYQSATMDHINARSNKDSSDEESNLVLSCPACNQMLSRAGELKTFPERKAFLEGRRKERSGKMYTTLVNKLRT